MVNFKQNKQSKSRQDDLIIYNDLYDGYHSKMIEKAYLWPHELEDNPKVTGSEVLRRIREMRTRYENDINKIFFNYIGILFKKEPAIDAEVRTLLGDAFNDIDGEGNDLVTFVRNKLFKTRFINGYTYLRTNTPKKQASSLAEEQTLGLRPFWEIVDPLSVKDWLVNPIKSPDAGVFKNIRTEYFYIPERESVLQEETEVLRSEVLVLQDGSVISAIYEQESEASKEWKLVSTTTIDVTRIPIVFYEAPESFIECLVSPVLTHYNLQSSLMSNLNYSAHQQKIITGNFNADTKQAFAEYTTVFVPQGSGVTVIEPSGLTALRETVAIYESKIYKNAFYLKRVISAGSKESESADTIREAKEDFLSIMKTEIATINMIVNKGLQDFAMMKNVKNFTGTVTFSDDLSIEDSNELIAIGSAYKDDIKQMSPTAHKQMITKALEFAGVKSDTITKEIEDYKIKDDSNPVASEIGNLINNI